MSPSLPPIASTSSLFLLLSPLPSFKLFPDCKDLGEDMTNFLKVKNGILIIPDETTKVTNNLKPLPRTTTYKPHDNDQFQPSLMAVTWFG